MSEWACVRCGEPADSGLVCASCLAADKARGTLSGPITLPDHLQRVSAPDDRAGNLQCQVCGRYVTVSPEGIEFGHLRRRHDSPSGRCPHRPAAVDPDGTHSEALPDELHEGRDDHGRFASP